LDRRLAKPLARRIARDPERGLVNSVISLLKAAVDFS
jgi:hypothetical protein